MKPSMTLRIAAVSMFVAACIACLAACSSTSSNSSGGVAATVNGVEIQEQTITDYI